MTIFAWFGVQNLRENQQVALWAIFLQGFVCSRESTVYQARTQSAADNVQNDMAQSGTLGKLKPRFKQAKAALLLFGNGACNMAEAEILEREAE